MKDSRHAGPAAGPVAAAASGDLETLLAAPLDGTTAIRREGVAGVVVGTLIGFGDHGATPLVTFPGQPTAAAQPARSTIDLHAAHVGRHAVLVFEGGEPCRPIVIGCLEEPGIRTIPDGQGDVEVEADGQRMVITAKEQLVLRCGTASVTLTKEGKILLRGTYVSSQASGVQRIRGGSVQIN